MVATLLLASCGGETAEEEEERPVYWKSRPPEVNISGFFIQVGYKILFL